MSEDKEFCDWMNYMEDMVSKVYGISREMLMEEKPENTRRIIIVGADRAMGRTVVEACLRHNPVFDIIEPKNDMIDAMMFAMQKAVKEGHFENKVIQLSKKDWKTISFKTWDKKKIKLPRKRKKACIGRDGLRWYKGIIKEYKTGIPQSGLKFPKRYNYGQNW